MGLGFPIIAGLNGRIAAPLRESAVSSSLKVILLFVGLVVAGGAALLILSEDEVAGPGSQASPISAESKESKRVDLPPPSLPESERSATKPLDVARTDLTASGTGAADRVAADVAAEVEVLLSGRVVDPSGRPVADAEVSYLAGGDRQLRRRFRRFTDDTEEIEFPKVTTDAEGRFSLSGEVVSLDAEAQRFFRLDAMLAVRHEAFATLVEAQPDLKPGTLDVGDLMVEPGAWVHGRVVDARGVPLEDVDIRARNVVENPFGSMGLGNFLGGAMVEFLDGTKTSSDGRFTVKGLLPGAAHVTARMEGMRPASSEAIEISANGPGNVGDLVMETGATIAGYVTDHDGAPVEGATIRVSSMARIMIGRMEDAPRQDIGHEMSLRAQTDPTGFFELSGLSGGTYTVHASAEGFARSSEADIPVGTYDLTLTLDPLGKLFVRVIDARTGAPVDGATLDAEEQRGEGRGGFRMRRVGGETRPVLTGAEAVAAAGLDVDSAGAYLIQDASPEGMDITVEAEGFALTVAQAEGVYAEDVGSLEIELLPETIVAGYVLDEQGDPIEHARVRLSPQDDGDDGMFTVGEGTFEVRREVRRRVGGGPGGRGGDGESHTARSDSAGYFEVRGVPAGEWELTARADTFVRSDAVPMSLGEGERRDDIALELAMGGSIAGVVTEADGEPVAGIDVTITSTDVEPDPALEGLPPGLAMFGGMGGDGQHRASTDSDGRYEQDSLPPGRYRVKLAPANMMNFGGGGGRRGGGFMSFITDSADDGTDEGAIFVDVVAGTEASADFVRPRRGEIRGRITAAGEPATDVTVSLREADSFMPFGGREATTDRLGNYRFDDVEAGEYTVSALPAGAGLEERLDVDVRMGETRMADLTFGGSTLRGRVLDKDSGLGAAGVFLTVAEVKEDEGGGFAGGSFGGEFQIVTAVDIDDGGGGRGGMEMTLGGGPISRVKTDNQGWFELKYMSPGTFTVETSGGGFINGEAGPIDLGENERVDDIEIEVVRGAVINGVVVSGKSGEVLSHVPVRLSGNGTQEMTTTDDQGGFNFEGLSEGVYDVSVMGSGFFAAPIAEEAVELKAGQERRLSLITDG